jgi:carbohydrate-selective porin OprB
MPVRKSDSRRVNVLPVLLGLAFLFGLFLCFSQAGPPVASASSSERGSTFAQWWSGPNFTGDLLGARDTLDDRGLKITGKWRGAFYGMLDSENGQRGVFDQEIVFGATLDLAKLTGFDALNGLSAFGETRWRDNRGDSNPNDTVEASTMFNPSHFQSGVGWRLLTFGLKYTTPKLFGAKDFLTLTGGWLRPQREFIDQPLSKLFVNNAVESSKGVGGNIPFSSSFSTWGGTIEVKPLPWQYTKAGLFMSYPNAMSSDNHGLMFQGCASDPSQNMLMFMGETGITPQIGSAKLPGRYAFGGYFYGQDTAKYGNSKYGFYWQADQMLFREASATASSAAGASDGKSLTTPVNAAETPALSKQGLRLFSLFTCAPPDNNRYPFYMQGGFVYEGLLPLRDRDLLLAVVGLGQYAGVEDGSNTAVIEIGYRLQVNGWAFVQPYFQYLSRPNGTSEVANASVLGFLAGVDF